MNGQNYLANLLTDTYLFDIPKVESSLEEAWNEYQRLLSEAEETRDLYTITQARVYLYFLGYFFPEEFARGALERRLRSFEPEINFEDFIKWADSGNVPEQYEEDELFKKVLKFYQITKDFKNKDVNGSYLDENRFNKIYAEILGKTVSDVYMWEQRKRQTKEEFKEEKIGKELKGVIASEGQVQGKAFIIQNEEDLQNFPEGYILVTSMTTPRFLPAMQRSIGIITDFGGVISHPAIIARELKIPCIVGTKYGSLTIKNDDLVEVDAEKGIVKILS